MASLRATSANLRITDLLYFKQLLKRLDLMVDAHALFAFFACAVEPNGAHARVCRAEDIRRQLLQGADIGSFVGSSVNEDMQNVAPYFLVRDVYAKEMENAAFALGFVGDVSAVVDVGTGYYVMVLQEYNEMILLLQASDLFTSYQWAKVEQIVDTFRPKISIELNDYGKSIDLLTIR